jgi:hypothetical protein
MLFGARNVDSSSVKLVQAMYEHSPISFLKEIATYLNDEVWSDPDEVPPRDAACTGRAHSKQRARQADRCQAQYVRHLEVGDASGGIGRIVHGRRAGLSSGMTVGKGGA